MDRSKLKGGGNIRRQSVGAVILACAFLAASQQLRAAASEIRFLFRKIADTNTPIPNGDGAFTTLQWAQISLGRIVFVGRGSNGQSGIYEATRSGISAIVDTDTQIPGTDSQFTDLGNRSVPAIDGSSIVFLGFGGPGEEGVYRLAPNQSPTLLADRRTGEPTTGQTFDTFRGFASDDARVAFAAEVNFGNPKSSGIYSYQGGSIESIASVNTSFPFDSSQAYLQFGEVVLADSNAVVFSAKAADGVRGIYKGTGTNAERIVGIEESGSGGSTLALSSLEGYRYSSGVTLFRADIVSPQGASIGHGIFMRDGSGAVSTIADTSTFHGFTAGFALDASNHQSVAFIDESSVGGHSLHLHKDGGLHRVLSERDQLLGHEVTGIDLVGQSLMGNAVVFKAELSDGSEAIYRADPLVFQAPFYKPTPHVVTQAPGGAFSHTGLLEFDVDLAQRPSDGRVPILASLGGTLRVHEQDEDGFGRFVTVDHGPDPGDPSKQIFTVYAHLDSIRAQDGEIEAGDIIGIEGSTGFATGTHLHFGVYRGDPNAEPFGDSWEKVGFGDATGPLRLGAGADGPFNLYDTSGLEALEGQFVFSAFEAPEGLSSAGVLAFGESRELDFFADGTSRLMYTLTWQGSALAIDIVQPDGSSWPGGYLTSDTVSVSGELPLVGGLWTFRILGSASGGDGSSFEFSVVAVPEPSTMTMLVIGTFLIAVRGIRRHQVS